MSYRTPPATLEVEGVGWVCFELGLRPKSSASLRSLSQIDQEDFS